MRHVFRFVVVTAVLSVVWARGSTTQWQSWRSAQNRQDNGAVRAMVDRVRPGMTYGEVAYILGPANRARENVWLYLVPNSSTFHVAVKFDEGRVEEVVREVGTTVSPVGFLNE
ncbi:hypothetical protein [Humisphaera borealis]|uniref:Uncharacterized protein n=1 Tax=Humisphaera borealis TaxID=2807512 RepID=A0A7M2WZN6_9BACT|nr:hypothetical protein [Humisphaera borealis]QOV90863.1 hypothetical protein IPV69_05750 [Humisphaera borealis]